MGIVKVMNSKTLRKQVPIYFNKFLYKLHEYLIEKNA